MTTAQQVFDWTMDLIDERMDNGTISTSNTISYQVKTPGILTMLQSELVKQGDLFRTHQIVHTPISNTFGYRYGFGIETFMGAEKVFTSREKAQAYYFEVDGPATVYVEDYTGSWNVLKTIVASPTESGFNTYKGIVTASTGATQSRLRFSGSTFYRIQNIALYDVPFAFDADVPDYRPWVKHEMPSDFKSVNEIINEEQNGYTQSAGYKWEGKRDLYISYDFNGTIRIVYRPIPNEVVEMTDDLQLDDITCRTILPYGLAAHLLLQENPDAASYFNERFEELKYEATKRPPAAFEQIENLYGGLDG